MFTEEEIEALVLGIRSVAERGDERLGEAAGHAPAKITTARPPPRRNEALNPGLLVGPVRRDCVGELALPVIRSAIRSARKRHLSDVDRDGSETRRTLWPFAVGFFEHNRVLAAWRALRQGHRYFRTGRIAAVVPADERYPRRLQTLLKEWRAAENIPNADNI
jgi:predicted DNA-binding transcriptional regulator YafY